MIADDEDDNDGAEENDEEDGEDGEDGGGDEGDEEDGNNAMQEDAEDDDEDVNQDEDLKVKKATLLPMSDSVKKLVKALGKKVRCQSQHNGIDRTRLTWQTSASAL